MKRIEEAMHSKIKAHEFRKWMQPKTVFVLKIRRSSTNKSTLAINLAVIIGGSYHVGASIRMIRVSLAAAIRIYWVDIPERGSMSQRLRPSSNVTLYPTGHHLKAIEQSLRET